MLVAGSGNGRFHASYWTQLGRGPQASWSPQGSFRAPLWPCTPTHSPITLPCLFLLPPSPEDPAPCHPQVHPSIQRGPGHPGPPGHACGHDLSDLYVNGAKGLTSVHAASYPWTGWDTDEGPGQLTSHGAARLPHRQWGLFSPGNPCHLAFSPRPRGQALPPAHPGSVPPEPQHGRSVNSHCFRQNIFYLEALTAPDGSAPFFHLPASRGVEVTAWGCPSRNPGSPLCREHGASWIPELLEYVRVPV